MRKKSIDENFEKREKNCLKLYLLQIKSELFKDYWNSGSQLTVWVLLGYNVQRKMLVLVKFIFVYYFITFLCIYNKKIILNVSNLIKYVLLLKSHPIICSIFCGLLVGPNFMYFLFHPLSTINDKLDIFFVLVYDGNIYSRFRIYSKAF